MPNQEPPRGRKKSTFTNVTNVLNALVDKLGLDRRLREQALLNLWPLVAGDTFALNTRPIFIDYENNLVVAVKDASVAQELSFVKRQITDKLKHAGLSTGIQIKGLRLDLKHFHTNNLPGQNEGRPVRGSDDAFALSFPSELPDDKALAELKLSASELNEIADLKRQIEETSASFLHQSQGALETICERISKLMEREVRLKKWQQMNGSPSCQSCGQPAIRLHTQTRVCSYCFLKQKAEVP